MQKCKLCNSPAIVSCTGTQYYYCNVCMERVKKQKRRAADEPVMVLCQDSSKSKNVPYFYVKLVPYLDEERYYWMLFKGANIFMWDRVNQIPDSARKSDRLTFLLYLGMTVPQALLSYPMASETPKDIFLFTKIHEKLKRLEFNSPKKSCIGFCEKCGAPTCIRDRYSFWPTCLRCK